MKTPNPLGHAKIVVLFPDAARDETRPLDQRRDASFKTAPSRLDAMRAVERALSAGPKPGSRASRDEIAQTVSPLESATRVPGDDASTSAPTTGLRGWCSTLIQRVRRGFTIA
jgi:hypothetical protein